VFKKPSGLRKARPGLLCIVKYFTMLSMIPKLKDIKPSGSDR